MPAAAHVTRFIKPPLWLITLWSRLRELKRFVYDPQGGITNGIGGQLITPDPLHLVGIRPRRGCGRMWCAQVIYDDVVILDAAVRCVMNAIDDVDQLFDAHLQGGFLEDFPGQRRFQGLAEFNRPAGKAPFTLEWSVPTPHQEHATPIDDDRPDANHGPLRKAAHAVKSPSP